MTALGGPTGHPRRLVPVGGRRPRPAPGSARCARCRRGRPPRPARRRLGGRIRRRQRAQRAGQLGVGRRDRGCSAQIGTVIGDHHHGRPGRVVVHRPLPDHGGAGRRGDRPPAAPRDHPVRLPPERLDADPVGTGQRAPGHAVDGGGGQAGPARTGGHRRHERGRGPGCRPRRRALHGLGGQLGLSAATAAGQPAAPAFILFLGALAVVFGAVHGVGGAPHPGGGGLRGRPLPAAGPGQPGVAGHLALVPAPGRHPGRPHPGEVRDRLGPEPGRRGPGRSRGGSPAAVAFAAVLGGAALLLLAGAWPPGPCSGCSPFSRRGGRSPRRLSATGPDQTASAPVRGLAHGWRMRAAGGRLRSPGRPRAGLGGGLGHGGAGLGVGARAGGAARPGPARAGCRRRWRSGSGPAGPSRRPSSAESTGVGTMDVPGARHPRPGTRCTPRPPPAATGAGRARRTATTDGPPHRARRPAAGRCPGRPVPLVTDSLGRTRSACADHDSVSPVRARQRRSSGGTAGVGAASRRRPRGPAVATARTWWR